MSICTAAWILSLWKELGMGCSQGGGQEGFSLYVDIHAFCWWLWFGSSGEHFLLPSRMLGRSLFALVHWEYTESRVYESSLCSWNDTAVLKPQHQLNINQTLNAKFVGPAKGWLCRRGRKEDGKERTVCERGLREHPWTQGTAEVEKERSELFHLPPACWLVILQFPPSTLSSNHP